MRVQSLGGLTLEGSDLRRPKPLALLTYLALEGRQDRRFLAELFWPRAADPRKSLTVALVHLRAAAPAAFEANRTHVQARVGIDVRELLEALEEGRTEQALALYRGPFLHGLDVPAAGPELEEWVYRTREFVADRVAIAQLDLAEREAASHGARAALARAEAAARVSEPAHFAAHDLARLHKLLVRAGSPLARRLRDEANELGIPLDEAPAEPASSLPTNSPDGGAGALAAASPGARPRPWHPTSELVGRAEELDAAMTLLRSGEGRLVTVTGPPGVGKTRLALELARRLAEDGDPEHVHFVPLGYVDQPEQLGASVAEALGLGTPGERDAWAQLAGVFGDRPQLLVLDDFEQLVPAAADLAWLLAACPNLSVVVTSRQRLNLTVEHVLPLEGLALPDPATAFARDAATSDAVRLFLLRAQRHRPALTLDESAVESVLAICRSTGGLPLALELAAAWVRVLPLDQIAAELEGDLDLLDHDAADLPPTQRSIRAAIERSWRLLPPPARATMTRLAVINGDFDRRAAEAVADASAHRLAALLDASLLRWDGSKRYSLHALIRRFVRERASDDPELLHDAEERHARHFLGRLAEHPKAFRRWVAAEASGDLFHDLDDAVAAWRWAVAARRSDLLEAAVEPFGWMLYRRGRLRLGLELMAGAEPCCRGSAPARFRAMYLVADGRASEAVPLMERTLERRPAATPLERAHQLRVLGVARLALPESDRAASERDFREALTLYEREDDDEGVAMMRNNLANLAPDPHAGLALARGAERAAERGGEHHARVMALTTQANLQLWFTGDYHAAAAAADEAAHHYQRSGFDLQAPAAILLRAEAHLALGLLERVERDVDALAQAADRVRHAFTADWRAAGLALRARVARLSGDRGAATAHARATLAEPGTVGGHAHASAHLLLAALSLEDGHAHDAEAALVRLERTPTAGRVLGLGPPEFVLATGRACAAAALAAAGSRMYEAESRLRAALGAARRARSLPSSLAVIAAFAALRRQQRQTAEAARLQDLIATHPAAHAEARALIRHDGPATTGSAVAAAPRRPDAAAHPPALEDVVRQLLEPVSPA
jgi:predicted ATPase